jgi:DNA-directed RNA polymerase specialized sigma24 family protein
MRVTQAVASLPDAYRRALELALEGLSDEEAAAALEVPTEAINPLLRLAVAKLESLLSSRDGRNE